MTKHHSFNAGTVLAIIAALVIVNSPSKIRPLAALAVHRTTQPQSTLPFDLVGNSRDANQILLQPKWGGQTAPNVFPNALNTTMCPKKDFSGPECSSGSHEVDAANIFKFLICVAGGAPAKRAKGHVNWEPATYEGTISFNEYSDDFDWTWNFEPLNQEGLTQQNPPSGSPEFIHAEFNATETVEGFLTSTWAQLRDGFGCFEDEPDCAAKNLAARKLVGGRRAILTGLLGLDTEHGGYSEIHPVYALAIEVNPDPNNDTWILFIRNRGNEGFCSQHDHALPPLDQFRLQIPKPINSQAIGATFTNQTSFSSTQLGNCPTFGFDSASNGVEVDFAFLNLPVRKPFRGPILEGEIHIQWQLQGPAVPFQPHQFSLQPVERDERFLSSPQRKQYRESMKAKNNQVFGALPGFHMCSAPIHALTLTQSHPTTKRVSRRQIESEQNAYYRRMINELCRANSSLAGCSARKRKRK